MAPVSTSPTDTEVMKMTIQTQNNIDCHEFRLMDLPAELREQIYCHASALFPPIDTASIRNTPDTIHIPAIAQLSKQTRQEALAVFYRNREVQLSLHCYRNVERSIAWLINWGDDAHLTNSIVFSGLMKPGLGNIFHLTLNCLRKDSGMQYRVSRRPHADPRSEKTFRELEEKISAYINKKVESDQTLQGEVGKLTKSEILDIFDLVQRDTGWHPPAAPEPRRCLLPPSSKRQRRFS
ncbi:hypothetical protein DOTSEDRAFT_22666 [Dothistroma septosporum NZE10]|uniref:F-box domain-containing protein n=1 Tax=Dothistroma septosporum (strain NZE10 / CBS 128990) TaxID=675120 RepID=N1PTC3_DOTSN|nr:hypothetical protein DOTSEDRAFT_22666 [Dothistroma septosporum NZE10]